MSHKGTDLGEFLHLHGLLPVTLEQDANVIESFLPAAFVEEIDAIETQVDKLPAKKKQKVSQFQKGKTTKADNTTYIMRRRQPTKYSSSLKRKVNKLSCCVDTETHMHTRDVAASAVATNTLTTWDITAVSQGDSITERTGNKISIRGVAISMGFSAITGPLEVFLIRPSNTNAAPLATDFDFSTGPGKMLKAGKGWVIRKYTIDPVLKKSLDVFIPLRMNSYFDGAAGPISNKLYLAVYNDSGVAQTWTGSTRIFFTG